MKRALPVRGLPLLVGYASLRPISMKARYLAAHTRQMLLTLSLLSPTPAWVDIIISTNDIRPITHCLSIWPRQCEVPGHRMQMDSPGLRM